MRACDRPGCTDPVRHQPHLGGDTFDGWRAVCCAHADEFMALLATTVDRAEGEAGWLAWLASHEAECGPIGATA